MPQALTVLVATLLALQGQSGVSGVSGAGGVGGGTTSLRKSDLVRLLSGATMTPVELAQLVRRNCLTFHPTDRDRNDFRLLGADPSLLTAIDECTRRRAPRRPTSRPASPPPPAPPPAPAPVFQVQRIIVHVSAERSSFVSGGGQRGSVGTQLPRALVFEARDSAGTPLSGEAVTFTGINASIHPAVIATDAAGQARVGVTLGERVASATVIAAMGVVEKQVAFNVAAGPAAQLIVMCGTARTDGTRRHSPGQRRGVTRVRPGRLWESHAVAGTPRRRGRRTYRAGVGHRARQRGGDAHAEAGSARHDESRGDRERHAPISHGNGPTPRGTWKHRLSVGDGAPWRMINDH